MKLSNPINDRRAGIYRKFYWRCPVKLACLLSIVAGCLISACDQRNNNLALATKTEKGKKVEFTTSESITSAQIPPIDAAAPTVTETATFALG